MGATCCSGAGSAQLDPQEGGDLVYGGAEVFRIAGDREGVIAVVVGELDADAALAQMFGQGVGVGQQSVLSAGLDQRGGIFWASSSSNTGEASGSRRVVTSTW